MTPSSTRDAARALWIIPVVYFVFVTAELTAMTHLALSLTAAGRSAFDVGVLAAAMWSGILVASRAAHPLVERAGHARVFVAATALAALAVLSFGLLAAYGAWLGGAVTLGLGGGLVWVSGEAWLAERAPRDRRGLYVGLFETAVGLGLMVGPALVPLAHRAGVAPLTVAAALMIGALVAAMPLLGEAAPHGAHADAADAGTRSGLGTTLLVASMVSGLMESGVSALLPSISMRLGADLDHAALLGTMIGAGSALLQPPAGWTADRIGTPRALRWAWAVVLGANLLLVTRAADPGAVLWVVGFVLGGVGGAVYTLLVIDLGHRLVGAALVRAVGLLVTSYAVGTAAGPALGGWLFDRHGLVGLAGAMTVLSAVGLALAPAREARRR